MTDTDMDRLREIGRLRAGNERMARMLRQIGGMAREGCEAPNTAYRWCERIDDVAISGPQDEYDEWVRHDQD